MLRGAALNQFAQLHGMLLVSIAEIATSCGERTSAG